MDFWTDASSKLIIRELLRIKDTTEVFKNLCYVLASDVLPSDTTEKAAVGNICEQLDAGF